MVRDTGVLNCNRLYNVLIITSYYQIEDMASTMGFLINMLTEIERFKNIHKVFGRSITFVVNMKIEISSNYQLEI